MGQEGQGLGFRAGQIGQSVTNGSPRLRCFFRAVLPWCYAAEMDPATRFTLRRNDLILKKVIFQKKNAGSHENYLQNEKEHFKMVLMHRIFC